MAQKINIDLSELLELQKNKKSVLELSEHFKVSTDLIRKHLKRFNLSPNKPIRRNLTLSEKTHLSLKRKEWLSLNPTKHPWKSDKKFISKPCELVKKFLKIQNINFIEEYSPNIQDTHFAIDIAIPSKNIGIEINGNQHYNSDKTLKPYYQHRHNLLVEYDWTILELHYSICFNNEKLIELADTINNTLDIKEFSYETYVINTVKENRCFHCEKPIWKTSTYCASCAMKKYYGSLTQSRTENHSLEENDD